MRLIFAALLLLFTPLCGAQSSTAPAISRRLVVQALQHEGIVIEEDQVQFPCQITSAASNPQVRFVSTEYVQGQAATLRMRCATNSECIPFLVKISFDSASEAHSSVVQLNRSRMAGIRKSRSEHRVPAVKTGSKVTLLIQTPGMIINIPVICLQSGAIGDRIRVAGSDRKEIYVAEVTSSQTVKLRI